MGFLDSVFDPGKDNRNKASKLAKQGLIKGGGFTGPGGIGGSFDFTDGVGTSNFDLGSFESSLASFQGLTQSGLASAGGGLPQSLIDRGGATNERLGQQNVSQLQNTSDFQGLGNIFQSAAQTAGADPFELGAGISEKLRALSERRNSRLVNKTFDRLKASGKLGTTGGAGIAAELEQNQFDQGLQFDIAGLQQGQSMQQAAFARAMAASQGREAIGGRQFGESFALEQMGGNRALQQFGVDSNLQAMLQAQQAQGANIAFGANQAAMSTSQLPLAFQQAMLAAQGQASNSNFAAAGIEQQNAAMATSPFLEALGAAGQFASGIAPLVNAPA